MSYKERAELYAVGEHPPDRAVAAVALQERINTDRLHCPVVRVGGEHEAGQ